MSTLFVCIAILTILYFFIARYSTYWARKDVPQSSFFKLVSVTLRSILQLEPQSDILKKMYNEFPDKRYSGSYQFIKPLLLVRDPDLIKQIAVKDFEHFVDHQQFIPEDIEPLWGKNLFALKGDRWRDMRATLSPSFTSSKMRGMFTLMDECAGQFVAYFKKTQDVQLVEMKDAFTRFANDVIASVSFGIHCDSLAEKENEFYMMGKKATTFRGFWSNVKFFVMLLSPTLAQMLGFKFFTKEVSEFFRRLVSINIQSREKNGVVRPDMIHLLMEAKKGNLRHEDQTGILDAGFAVIEESQVGKEETRQKQILTNDDVTAQALIFFFAGFETVSNLMCFAVYELAVNPDVQETLRREIDETLESCNGAVNYEGLLKMKYMDMVVSETLRKWPSNSTTDRLCIKPYTIQPASQGEKPVYLEKGDVLWIPTFAIHRDPKFYPNPDSFDPERFSEENKSQINPYAYIPFGVGPRSCIGNRLALLETKIILFYILANFEVLVSETTTVPLKLAKDSFDPTSDNGFWFKLRPRSL